MRHSRYEWVFGCGGSRVAARARTLEGCFRLLIPSACVHITRLQYSHAHWLPPPFRPQSATHQHIHAAHDTFN